ncbi:MAG: hydantoinase B/oxoprolinase family protein, partial [Planctomycetes bacterium]|nr:hydantoinase B/oxoprolinase family protein [Planctomycetota bacterium]
GEVAHLGSVATVKVETGDVLVVETPGGGGWGRP